MNYIIVIYVYIIHYNVYHICVLCVYITICMAFNELMQEVNVNRVGKISEEHCDSPTVKVQEQHREPGKETENPGHSVQGK